jgi:two-component system LytT family sensor kinase
MAEKYLALENLRLADRLKVEWSVAADVGRFAVPSFSLQTLLENAIKHGLSPKPEGGTVGIRLGLSDERLVLAVEDDGVGADPSEVTREEGRGLSVLGQRLAALYGSAASLTWRTAPGDGFSVLLEVPATPAGELATGRVVETGGGPGRNR